MLKTGAPDGAEAVAWVEGNIARYQGDPARVAVMGHSAGAYQAVMLALDAKRLVAAYLIGWPVSVEHDLPVIGFPPCLAPGQTGCLISWSSFAEPADPAAVLKAYGSTPALDGDRPGTSPMLCTNPLTGLVGGTAPAQVLAQVSGWRSRLAMP